MIIKSEERKSETREHMRGGAGEVVITHYTDREGLYDKGRMLAHILLKPGCEVGYHDHQNEEEIFIVVKGEAVYNDNGVETVIKVGDSTYCRHGENHGVINKSDEDCELVALILDK